MPSRARGPLLIASVLFGISVKHEKQLLGSRGAKRRRADGGRVPGVDKLQI